MITLNNKYAIGCLIQWYEIEMLEEYLQSVKSSLDSINNKENIVIDLYFNCSQALEKIDENQMTISDVKLKYKRMLHDIFGYDEQLDSLVRREYNINSTINDMADSLYTIADYRREFNDKYCEEVDVLMWGETDSLIPKQTFEILDILHESNKNQDINKYIAFFGGCKMWDDSWKPIEHTDFTDKSFIEGDVKNWWSLRYVMSKSEMDEINAKIEELDVRIVNPYKFNGCGLVISSDIIKSGVNISRSVFFIHEDTAFMNSLLKTFGGNIPQFVIKNILLVHNRKHPNKRSYVLGEDGIDKTDTGNLRKVHTWYDKANKMCEHNAYNMFNQTKIYTWKDVFSNSMIDRLK